jgi:pentatricopeptide repeat protein
MLARQGTRRALYLDFLAPSLLRNASSSAAPGPRPPLPLPRQDRTAHAPQKRSDIPQRPASQINQLISVKTKSEGPVPPTNSIDLFVKTITKLDATLSRNELSGIRELWATLVSRNLLKYLGIPQLRRYSKSVALMYGREPSSGGQGSSKDRETMQTIAIYTALCGHPEAIRAIVLHHLTAREPDEVLNLYQTYTTSQARNRTPQPPNPTEGVSIPEDIVLPEEKNDVLLGAIAACAMKGSFSDAVNMVVESHARIIHRAVEHHIHTLPNAPIVENYVRRLELVYLLAHPPAFLKHADNLAKDKAAGKLERLCKDIVAAILGDQPWLVVSEEQKSNERPVAVPRFTWTTLITALAKCKRPDLAGHFWEDMVRCGVKPDASIWTAVFDGYSALGAWQESLSTWDMMLTQDVEPEPLTYRAIIATLFKARRPDNAMTKFMEYERDWVGKGKRHSAALADEYSSQTLSLHNTVLHGLLTNSDRETHALAHFERMKTDGPTPDLISWNTVMGYYGKRGDMKLISSALQGLKESGLSPDVFTYSIILTTLLKAGREDAPKLILDMMKKNGINPGAAVNTTIIDQLLQEPDVDNMKAAFNILNRMEGERTPAERPNEVTYTTMLTGIYRWESNKEAEAHHSDVLRRMRKRGVQFNRATCHILIRASLESSSREGPRYALEHFRRMTQLKIEPDFDTWYIILDGMLRRGQIQIANDLVEEMARRRYEPTGALFGLINRIRRKR